MEKGNESGERFIDFIKKKFQQELFFFHFTRKDNILKYFNNFIIELFFTS